MTPAAKFIIFGILLVAVFSYRHDEQFVTFNSSKRSNGISTSIGSTVTFIPDLTEQKFRLAPVFPEDESRLYNEYSNGEFWYAFKKSFNPETTDATATFAFAKVTVNDQTGNYILPLFSLPLSFLNLDNLYRCDDVLISYQNTGSVIDVTIFSEK